LADPADAKRAQDPEREELLRKPLLMRQPLPVWFAYDVLNMVSKFSLTAASVAKTPKPNSNAIAAPRI